MFNRRNRLSGGNFGVERRAFHGGRRRINAKAVAALALRSRSLIMQLGDRLGPGLAAAITLFIIEKRVKCTPQYVGGSYF